MPKENNQPLRLMPSDGTWLAELLSADAVPADKFTGDLKRASWLPNEAVARAWMQYIKDTAVGDASPPPAPKSLIVRGNELQWECDADLQSGLAGFIIERDGQIVANSAEKAKNSFGRALFQNLQYSDTPTQPLAPMQFVDNQAEHGKNHTYRVIAVNTVGLKSQPKASN